MGLSASVSLSVCHAGKSSYLVVVSVVLSVITLVSLERLKLEIKYCVRRALIKNMQK